jgi:HlyD family secretion protein
MIASRLTLVVVAGLGVAACERSPHDTMLGTLERDRLELIAEAQEQIVALHVTEGDEVAAGTPLVELDRSAIDARLEQARAQASEAAARLTELENGARVEEIAAARADVAAAQARVVVAVNEYERERNLVERGLESRSVLDRHVAARDGAIADQRAAAARLEELTTGTRAEQIEQARETLSAREATVRQLEIDAARLSVRAPRPGSVDALPYELGERPKPGTTLVVLLADEAPYARVYVPEPLRAQVGVGSALTVRVDGVDRDFAGRVRFISAEAAFTPYYSLTQKDRSRLSYLAEVTLTDDAARDLPTGIPVELRLPGATEAP